MGNSDGDGGKPVVTWWSRNTNTAALTSQLSLDLALAQCTPHHTTSTMVVLDNTLNPELEEEEEEESSVVDSLTEEEMMTERSELGR